MQRPVFFDPTGRRRHWTRRIAFMAIAVLLLGCAAFASTVINVPAPSPLPIGYERMAPLPFRTQVSRLKHKVLRLFAAPPAASTAIKPAAPITVAFYTSWSDNSAQALAQHINQVDWVAPTLFSITGDGGLISSDDAPLRRVLGSNLHHPLVVPVVQNIHDGKWDAKGAAALLHDPHRRADMIRRLSAELDRSGDNGVMYDFENLDPAAMRDMVRLVSDTRTAFAPRHRVVSVTMPIDDPRWPVAALAQASDRLVLMAYDEHWQGGEPGPIASSAWFGQHLQQSLKDVDRSRVIVALGNYAYDWHDGRADSLTVEEAWLSARDSGTKPTFDAGSGNLGFSFAEDGRRHDVWLLDAAVSWNQMQALSRLGIGNIALWRLGSEDPGFWSALQTWRTGGSRPALEKIDQQQGNVDVEGNGEILRVANQPHPGYRSITFSAKGIGPAKPEIAGERYDAVPTPYVVQRTGDRKGLV